MTMNSTRSTPQWYCFRTEQKREQVAVEHIRAELKLEAFSPRVIEFKDTKRGRIRFSSAMFGCYAFVKMNPELDLASVNRTRGIVSALRYGSNLPVIPELFIEELRSELIDDCLQVEEKTIEVGSYAKVESGPFAGMIGRIVKAKNNNQRVAILLSIFSREAEVQFPRNSLARVEHSPI